MKIEMLQSKVLKYYSFVYYDSAAKKPVRLPRSYIQGRFGRDIIDPEEAELIKEQLGKEILSKQTEQEIRLAWEKDYPSFQEKFDLFLVVHRKTAPNSYRSTTHFLRYYVCHFFLDVMGCSDLDQWSLYHDEFKEWLEEKATLTRTPGQKISYNSKNHCIQAMNNFLKFLYRKQFISHMIPCTPFPTYQTKMRTVDDLISAEEMETLYEHLKTTGRFQEAVFFRLLFFSGMRYGETKGMSLQNVYEGTIEDTAFARRLAENEIPYFGYLVLESQPASKEYLRNHEGHVPRKPLKGKRKIEEKSSRIIPIIDQVLWKDLAVLYNQALESFHRKIWGPIPENYLFFESVDREVIKKAFKEIGLLYRSPHCCRHTRATWLIGETGDAMLARLWLGHSSTRVMERYVHIYQACVRKAKKGNRSQWSRIETEPS